MKDINTIVKRIENLRADEVDILEDDSIDTYDLKLGIITGIDFCLDIIKRENTIHGMQFPLGKKLKED
jgi:hypothetical protein